MARRGSKPLPDTEVVFFAGQRFCRRPGKRYFKGVRLLPGGGHEPDFLHRAVWRHHHGDIPSGHDVHHVNGDFNNNDLSNLECSPHGEHMRRHWQSWKSDPEVIGRMVAWTTTEEGKQVLRRNGRVVWEGVEPKTYLCRGCGVSFQSRCKSGRAFYCSARCREAHYRHLGGRPGKRQKSQDSGL